MLTKQERAAIAARFVSYDDGTLYFAELFECLFNREIPGNTTTKEDTEAVIDRLIDLCDTSNMVELPRDKDGEVIRVGDTVYDEDGEEGKVGGYYCNNGNWKIIIPYGENGCFINVRPNEISHKKSVTIVSLNERLRHVLDKGQMSAWSMAELCDIADDLEMLGDSDD